MFDLTLPARTPLPQPPFLPTTRAEMDAIGWDSLDILLVTGDAYVDHPSFGVPLLGRWLVGHGSPSILYIELQADVGNLVILR